MKRLFLPMAILFGLEAGAQLTIQTGATFYIDPGAVVTVQGNVESQANIQGTGKLLMKGTSAQQLSMNSNTVPNLEIDNTANVTLGSPATISTTLGFVNGKLLLGAHDLTMASGSNIANAGTGKFVETNGAGLLQMALTAVGSYTYPLGNGTRYTPLTLNLANATLSSAKLGAKSTGEVHPAKHIRSSDHLNTYWSISRTGITGGTVTATGTYVDAGSLVGTEAPIRSFKFENAAWAAGTGNDATANTVSASLTANQGDLYAMNNFALANVKVFLQGAFDGAVGLMRDRLRNSTGSYAPGAVPAGNLLPSSDPYRDAPYNGYFLHTANPVIETATADAFKDKANSEENIVDWVFVELRNTNATGNEILQTRSGFVLRNGNIVDVDGVSPLYFKDVGPGNYSIGVRHRNHLGLYTKPGTYNAALGYSAASQINMASGSFTANLNGTAGSAYLVSGSNVMLWTGNVNGNFRVNYNGTTGPGVINNNDRVILLTDLGASTFLTGYYRGDANMNRRVDYNGTTSPGFFGNNDRVVILNFVLVNASASSKIEARPM